ncbi:hypothetical protein FOPG_17971 [Fusarium oxysporum f. sp. conglutinans race 2 54008]|uniref:Uncharacterized protein n=1 Tax=Fusarium oxysporum f. sp. conglutinans race 2 54008 TaxID=1089457 RepID=X0H145_FUSOX|nr:hypothetical protein FOPG_17971 [Fusarium oxysporum f. sp. conglutinans race 2 54008]
MVELTAHAPATIPVSSSARWRRSTIALPWLRRRIGLRMRNLTMSAKRLSAMLAQSWDLELCPSLTVDLFSDLSSLALKILVITMV